MPIVFSFCRPFPSAVFTGSVAMPIVVKDYTWKETDVEVVITVPLKGVKGSKTDIFSTDSYIKVSYPPYLFEVLLYASVIEERCVARVGNGMINFTLIKKEPGIWGRLHSEESESKEKMIEKRAEAVDYAHRSAKEVADQKAKKKREEESFAIRQQMKLEEEERGRIEREKQDERDKTTRELEEWQKAKQKPTKKEVAVIAANKQNDVNGKSGKTKNHKPPPPRTSGSIQVHFTPRVFPTAARESKEEEEQAWLTKMAAARKIKTDKKDTPINERNPEFFKDKGVDFFKNGNYEGAINAFTEGLKLSPHLPQLFSNRAACFLAMGEDDKCISDCTRALELFYPVVPSNYASRAKVFVRRGTGYANVGELGLAQQDFNAALKLRPDDEKLQEDYAKIKAAYENS